jgi:hypothetical protein
MTTDNNPVTVVQDTNPDTPHDTVVTARFSRKRIGQALGTAFAVVAGLAIFGSAMKERGKNEFIDDVRTAADDTDETVDKS